MDAWHRPDKEVGKDLVKGTLVAGVAGATAGATIGILRQQPVAQYAFSGGLNASLFGMTFIAFRESFLRFQRNKNPYYGLKDSQTMDIDQLWSSTVAGACTGGILSALARGPKTVPSGTFMFGAMALGGQWVLNKANRYRQDRILETTPLENTAVQAKRIHADSQEHIGTGLLKVLPVHRTDVDDYEKRLLQKLELIEREQGVLEEEILRRKKIAVSEAVQEKPAVATTQSHSPGSSSSEIKKGQDMSKSTVIQNSTRPRPSLSHKFERPNTRQYRSPDGRSGVIKSRQEKEKTQLDVAKVAISGPTIASIPEPTKPSDVYLGESQSAGRTDQSRKASDSQEQDNGSVETIELPQTTGEAKADTNNLDAKVVDTLQENSTEPNGATDNDGPESVITATSITAPVTTPATPDVNGIAASDTTLSKILIAPQDTPCTPSTTATIDKPLPTPATPIPIPAQIAVVEAASPSKRVAFSPNKQESRFSNPNTLQVNKLKSILKPAPLRLDDGELLQSDRDGALSTGLVSTRGLSYSNSHSTDAESFVKTALGSLESDDLQLRASAYMDLQTKIRTGDDKPYLGVVRQTMRTFATYLMRDLDSSNPPSLYVVTPLLWSRLLSKPTCNLAIWSFTSAKIPPRILTPFVPQMIRAFLDNLDSRFKSSSITSESLSALFSLFVQFPGEIVPHVQEWLVPVIMRLVSGVPGIRSRALELLTTALPKLIEKEDSRRIQVVSKFMKDHSTDFFGLLTQNFLDDGDEVYAITVWGAMVTLAGRLLQKYSNLNPLLKMAEKCFNSTSSKRTEIKMATFQAWTRLIYNFAIGGHIASEKPLKLMMTPIKNCFLTERHKRVRLACTTTWIALIYALGPKLSKNADQVLFPLLKLAIADDSEHIRDLALRLIVALFSNTGGQDLVEGRQSIVPGTITFADLGWADATWVRTELLDHGLDCIFQTISLQHKIPEAGREDWRKLGLTELPLLTQRCARTWEGVVRAIRDINLQEKGMKATPEADRAVSSLLLFVEKVSRCDPKVLIPKEWPLSDPEKISLLKLDPNMAGFIVRADIVHYFYACVIDIFSARALVTTRYRVKDSIHADLYDAINNVNAETSQAGETVAATQYQGARDVTLSPLEFILKSWLATGESVVETALEDPFWQAVAFFVEMSTKGINVLRPLYKCLDHMEDIKAKRQTTSSLIWPSHSKGPVTPLTFRIFQCKYWAIVAQRLGVTIEKVNEISDDVTLGDQHGFEDFFSLMAYPFSILNEPHNARHGIPDMDHSQRVQESQDIEATENGTQFITTFKATLIQAWTGLLRSFYKVAQHKRSNANALMNTLANRIQDCYDRKLLFIWTQSLSIAFASVIVETVVLEDSGFSYQKPQSQVAIYGLTPNRHPSKQNIDNLLKLCSSLFEEAYNGIEKTKDLASATHIPPIQEAAFLLMEKIINKAPPSYIIQWFQSMQHSIVQWIDDPLMAIRRLPKASRRLYRARISSFWSHCVLRKLLGCSTESRVGGPKSAFGSVLPSPVSTIRSAMQQQAQVATTSRDGQALSSPFTSPTVLVNPFLENNIDNSSSAAGDNATEIYNSETLALLTPLLFAGLNSHHKSIVNVTLEFWNKSFGLYKKNLDYPDEIVSIMRQLKLVATISLPGWTFEDNSQTEVPQFASLSQEMLSLPAELNIKPGLSRLLKEKAEMAKRLSSRKSIKQLRMLGLEIVNPSGSDASTRTSTKEASTIGTTVASPEDDSSSSSSNYSSANNSRASTPSPWTTPSGTRHHTPAIGFEDSSAQSKDTNGKYIDRGDGGISETKETSKRKAANNRTVHSLEMDPIRRILVAKTSEISGPESISDPNTPEDSGDDVSEISSPSKRARKMNIVKENEQLQPLPAAPVWRLQSPLKPDDSSEDVSTSSSLAPRVDSAPSSRSVSIPIRTSDVGTHKLSVSAGPAIPPQVIADKQPVNGASSDESQGDAFSIMPAQPAPTNSIEDTGISVFENGPAQNTAKILISGGRNVLPVGDDSSMLQPEEAKNDATKMIFISDDSMTTNVEVDIPTTIGTTRSPASKSTGGPSIENKEDFVVAVRRLVEARGVVNQMDMRQLFDLQNQLMALSQTVCGVWGQFVEDTGDSTGNNSSKQ
ncbi:DNA-binding protein rif1 [Mortierella sp. AD094]|nr:DNA-binding protein rif1 [Mortierella sp. AD094]